MKKSQLIKIIKEEFKQIITEVDWNFPKMNELISPNEKSALEKIVKSIATKFVTEGYDKKEAIEFFDAHIANILKDVFPFSEATLKEAPRDFVGDDAYDKKPDVGVADNPKDVIKLDVPLFIRLLEYAREDAKSDLDIHNVTENALSLSRTGRTLKMSDYSKICKPQ